MMMAAPTSFVPAFPADMTAAFAALDAFMMLDENRGWLLDEGCLAAAAAPAPAATAAAPLSLPTTAAAQVDADADDSFEALLAAATCIPDFDPFVGTPECLAAARAMYAEVNAARAPAAAPAAAATPAVACRRSSSDKVARATPAGWRAGEDERALDALLGDVVAGSLFWSTPAPVAKGAFTPFCSPAPTVVIAFAAAAAAAATPARTPAAAAAAAADVAAAAPVASRTRSQARLAAPVAMRTRAKTAALRAKACVKCF